MSGVRPILESWAPVRSGACPRPSTRGENWAGGVLSALIREYAAYFRSYLLCRNAVTRSALVPGALLDSISDEGSGRSFTPGCNSSLRPPRACYGLCAARVSKRWSMRQAKATKCKPATVSGRRS